MSSKVPKVEHIDNAAVSFAINREAPPAQVLFYLFNEDGKDYELVVSHGRRLLGTAKVLWVLCQPRILDKVDYSLDEPMPDGMFQMYYYDWGEWLSLPEPHRPILITAGRALLWRRTGITDMPHLDAVIRMTADHAHPIAGYSNVPSTLIRGMFSFKGTRASPTLKGTLELITPSKPSVPRRARTLRGMRPGRMVTTGSKKPKALTAAGTVTMTASRLVLPSSSPPVQSSSPPAPSQILCDVFGDNWKSCVLKDSLTLSGARNSKHVRSPSPYLPDTPMKHPKLAFPLFIAGPSGAHAGATIAIPKGWNPAPKKAYRPPVDPKDIIDISEDIDDDEIKISRVRKGKGKARPRVPIPPDAENIELSN